LIELIHWNAPVGCEEHTIVCFASQKCKSPNKRHFINVAKHFFDQTDFLNLLNHSLEIETKSQCRYWMKAPRAST